MSIINLKLYCAFLIIFSYGLTESATSVSADTSIHRTHAYPTKITPHPGVGKFKLKHNSDKPIIAFYGGIGLHDLGNGQWTSYNIRSKSDVDLLIKKCRRYGVNRLYVPFLEEWTPTILLTQPPTISPDMVTYAIDLAHKNNIAVYATIAAFAVSDKDKPFLDSNMDTLTCDINSEPTPYMFSPAYPQVRAYKRAVILEWLAMYPVDGIQLDFIRWPYFGNDSLDGYCVHGYDKPLLNEFRTRHNLPENFKPEPNDHRFCELRAEYIDLFIKELRDSLQASDINLPIGVYNSSAYGRTQSFHYVCQDWQSWETQGLVNEHHPMFLLDNMTRLTRATQSLIAIKQKSTVFGPVFLAEAFEPSQGFVPTAQMCRDAAIRLIKLGCDGIWFCRGTEVEQYNLWPVVQEIGNYSIKEIRQKTFDPMYENLLENGNFNDGLKGWTYINDINSTETIKASKCSDKPEIQINLTKQGKQSLMQSHRFSTHPAMAVRSLQFSFNYKAKIRQTDSTTRVLLCLEYSDNHSEIKSFDLGDQNDWKFENIVFQVDHNSSLALRTATAQIMLPAGDGTIWLQKFELIYDPLDDPLKN
jgi:hypothetical protein